jgi:ABC-type lipoprotein release transport system permease subunit
MKKMFAILFVVAAIVTSCGDETSDAPIIQELTVLTDSVQINPGAVFQFKLTLSDDEGLSKYRIRVEDELDNARLQAAPWYYEEDFNLSGLSYEATVPLELPYPDIEPGDYRLDIIVVDIDGNETAEKRYFVIYE